mgnify:CR=1 FL=1
MLFERGAEGVIISVALLVANVTAIVGEKLMLEDATKILRSKTTVIVEVVATPRAPFTGVWLTISEDACAIGTKPNGTRRRSSTSLFIRAICKVVNLIMSSPD